MLKQLDEDVLRRLRARYMPPRAGTLPAYNEGRVAAQKMRRSVRLRTYFCLALAVAVASGLTFFAWPQSATSKDGLYSQSDRAQMQRLVEQINH